MDVVAEHLTQRCVEQMRGRVIALRIQALVARHRRPGAAEAKLPLERADRGVASLDAAHLVDDDLPPFAEDLTMVGDLPAGFRVERALAQHDRDAPLVQAPNGDGLGVHRHGVVADEARLLQRGRHLFPSREVGQLVLRDADLLRLPFLLRLRTLRAERALEAGDVDRVAAFPRHQLRQIDRKAERIVETEGVLA